MENNVTIRHSRADDFEWIKTLWYANRDTLSIPFNRCINELCTCDNCKVVDIDGTPVAFGRIRFARRCCEVRIEHLVVDEKFRGKGLGTILLKHLISTFVLNGSWIIEPEIIANAVVGAKNNLFYDKYSKSKTILYRKTKTLYRYVLDKEKLGI
jgi:GNAT superfamily N-acetyltransferase